MYNWKKSVAADLFDDEYIIANLDNGLYYCVQGDIINVLKSMPFESLSENISQLAEKITLIEHDKIRMVWDEILKEELIDSDYTMGDQSFPVVTDFIATGKPCKLAKYADMQDLLALDPIHEVDEKGWPEIEVKKP